MPKNFMTSLVLLTALTSVGAATDCDQSAKGPVDIMFLLDNTAQMCARIGGLGNRFVNMTQFIASESANVKIGVATFGSSAPSLKLGFTSNYTQVQQVFDDILTAGCSDSKPAAGLEALRIAATMGASTDFSLDCGDSCDHTWRTGSKRSIVLLTDGPSGLPTLTKNIQLGQPTSCSTSECRVPVVTNGALDLAWANEADLTASFLASNNIQTHLLIDGSNEAARLQYGNPVDSVTDGIKVNLASTLNAVNGSNAQSSVQTILSKSNGLSYAVGIENLVTRNQIQSLYLRVLKSGLTCGPQVTPLNYCAATSAPFVTLVKLRVVVGGKNLKTYVSLNGTIANPDKIFTPAIDSTFNNVIASDDKTDVVIIAPMAARIFSPATDTSSDSQTSSNIETITTTGTVETTSSSSIASTETASTSSTVETSSSVASVETSSTSSSVASVASTESSSTSAQVETTSSSSVASVETSSTSAQVETTSTTAQVETTSSSSVASTETASTSAQVETASTSAQVESSSTSAQVETTSTTAQVETTSTETASTSAQVETTSSSVAQVTTTSSSVEPVVTSSSSVVPVTTTTSSSVTQVETPSTSAVDSTTSSSVAPTTSSSSSTSDSSTSQSNESTNNTGTIAGVAGGAAAIGGAAALIFFMKRRNNMKNMSEIENGMETAAGTNPLYENNNAFSNPLYAPNDLASEV